VGSNKTVPIGSTSGEQGFVGLSNLAYILGSAKDIGENLPEGDAILRKSSVVLATDGVL